MKVNVNGIWYDSEETPILIQLSDADKRNIAAMEDRAKNYVVFPEKLEFKEVRKILKLE